MILYDVNMKGRRMCVENGLAKLLVRRYLNILTLKVSREKVFVHSPLTKNYSLLDYSHKIGDRYFFNPWFASGL